jgi:hypothetical protein
LYEAYKKALSEKITKKQDTFWAYRIAGWRTLLLLENTDTHWSSFENQESAFHRVWPEFSGGVDYVLQVESVEPHSFVAGWFVFDGRLTDSFGPQLVSATLTRSCER